MKRKTIIIFLRLNLISLRLFNIGVRGKKFSMLQYKNNIRYSDIMTGSFRKFWRRNFKKYSIKGIEINY